MRQVSYSEFCRLPAGTIYSAVSGAREPSGLCVIGVGGWHNPDGSLQTPEGWHLDPGHVEYFCDPVIGPKHFVDVLSVIYVLGFSDLQQIQHYVSGAIYADAERLRRGARPAEEGSGEETEKRT